MTGMDERIIPSLVAQKAKADAEAAEKMKDYLLEMNTAVYDKSQSYATIVIFGGYAAFFAIWSFTKEAMSKEQLYWSALLIGISVFLFVLFEVFKMLMTTRELLQVRRLLLRQLAPQAFLAERERIARIQQTLDMRVMLVVWTATLVSCLATGGAAVIILIAAFASYLASI